MEDLKRREAIAPEGISLKELLEMPLPPRRELLAPWLRTGESAMVWAPTGVGKSWFSLSVALAVAGGGEVFGWRAGEPSKVLYVDGEMHTAEVQERMSKLLEAEAIDGLNPDAAKENLVFHCRQNQDLKVQFWDLLSKIDHAALIGVIQQGEYSLVILDNFTVLSDSLADENSASAMKPAQNLMAMLKQAGVAAVLVHHSNKPGNSYRGSSAISTTFEVILGLQAANDPRKDRRNAAGFTLNVEKFRRERDDSMAERKAFLVGGRWEVEPIEDREARQVVEAYRSRRYVKQKEIAEALGMRQQQVSEALNRAVVFDMITKQEIKDCMEKARNLREGGGLEEFEDQEPNPDF